MKGLTPRQRDILNFIEAFIENNHYSPSYKEIMDHFSFSSAGSVYKFLQILKNKGKINLTKHSHRSTTTIKEQTTVVEHSTTELPLIGYISAGYPLELFAEHRTLQVPTSLIHSHDQTYVLQAQGNSFQDECILDGDFLLIEARQDIQPGEVVLGLINQHDSLLRRYFPEGQSIRLESQSPHTRPLTIRSDHILIQGALIGILRYY